MILIISIIILVLGITLFFWGPDILNSIAVAIEDWDEAIHNIRNRRS